MKVAWHRGRGARHPVPGLRAAAPKNGTGALGGRVVAVGTVTPSSTPRGSSCSTTVPASATPRSTRRFSPRVRPVDDALEETGVSLRRDPVRPTAICTSSLRAERPAPGHADLRAAHRGGPWSTSPTTRCPSGSTCRGSRTSSSTARPRSPPASGWSRRPVTRGAPSLVVDTPGGAIVLAGQGCSRAAVGRSRGPRGVGAIERARPRRVCALGRSLAGARSGPGCTSPTTRRSGSAEGDLLATLGVEAVARPRGSGGLPRAAASARMAAFVKLISSLTDGAASGYDRATFVVGRGHRRQHNMTVAALVRDPHPVPAQKLGPTNAVKAKTSLRECSPDAFAAHQLEARSIDERRTTAGWKRQATVARLGFRAGLTKRPHTVIRRRPRRSQKRSILRRPGSMRWILS